MKFRDISKPLQIMREILLGRKYKLGTIHNRFPFKVSPRTVPPPTIPRAAELKYSKNYYYARNTFDSVDPPVIAPVAEGPPPFLGPSGRKRAGGMKPDSVTFQNSPTPGMVWWWDGHCYFECVYPEPPPPAKTCAKGKPDPCKSK